MIVKCYSFILFLVLSTTKGQNATNLTETSEIDDNSQNGTASTLTPDSSPQNGTTTDGNTAPPDNSTAEPPTATEESEFGNETVTSGPDASTDNTSSPGLTTTEDSSSSSSSSSPGLTTEVDPSSQPTVTVHPNSTLPTTMAPHPSVPAVTTTPDPFRQYTGAGFGPTYLKMENKNFKGVPTLYCYRITGLSPTGQTCMGTVGQGECRNGSFTKPLTGDTNGVEHCRAIFSEYPCCKLKSQQVSTIECSQSIANYFNGQNGMFSCEDLLKHDDDALFFFILESENPEAKKNMGFDCISVCVNKGMELSASWTLLLVPALFYIVQ